MTLLFKRGQADQCPAWGGNSLEPREYYLRSESLFFHVFDAAFAELLWPSVAVCRQMIQFVQIFE